MGGKLRQPSFIHLHTHTAYSLLEGALRIDKLLDMALADEQPAIGIADSSNLFGALEFSQKAVAKGIQPIIGCELVIEFAKDEDLSAKLGFGKNSIVLIAMNEAGFINLSNLISKAYLEGYNKETAIFIDELEGEKSEGLICLSGGPEGAVDPLFIAQKHHLAFNRLDKLHKIFKDRFYIELQRHGLKKEQYCETFLIEYAYKNDIALVATNEAFFSSPADYEAHDALLAISSSTVLAQTNRRKLTNQHYYKKQKEMSLLFKDIPEALQNSVEIAKRVSFYPKARPPILPNFLNEKNKSSKESLKAQIDELNKQARCGLEERLKTIELAENYTAQDYRNRLEFELKTIANMKYPGYFLIVADFIQWAKKQNIPVGPGRGSGAGSLVAYALTITDLDPIRYNLLFERFLNPERISMPDFDIDFCQDRREEVIKYVQNKYGHDQVAQIITFGSLQARAALRDVGRVLQMPYPQVDRICKLVPSNPADPIKLADAILAEPKLQQMQREDETVAQLLEIAKNLEGLYRHASTHAAGIVIGDRPLQELVPLYRDSRSEMPVTQYSLKWVEAAGLVKFDFLGLKTLTVIDNTVKMIREQKDKNFSIKKIPLDDKLTYKLLQRGQTVGVFQFESQGMRKALIDLRPDRFEDLIALGALYRPGPMDNIGSFCNRKHGREKISLLHPALEPILEETYGIIVYQEQVMKIAQELSGYSLGEADLLRRAMGKKDKKEMAAQRTRFIKGAIKKGIEKYKATQIFDLLDKFANYGFNKSHAAAYAMLSYQTAYLKAHFPHEFLASSMTLDMGNTDKLFDFKREADSLGIEIVPPSINKSSSHFKVQDNKIIYSLSAIKGIGKQLAEHIEAIVANGTFKDLADFASHIDSKIINRRALEILVNAGALDELAINRETAFMAIETILATAQRVNSNKQQGMIDMFASENKVQINLPTNITSWSEEEKLNREFSAIGFHLSAHPLDSFIDYLQEKRVQKWSDFENSVANGTRAGRLAGVVVARSNKKTKKGTSMSIITLSDSSGSYECLVFAELIEKYNDILGVGNFLILDVEIDNRAEASNRLRLLSAQEIKRENETENKHLTIFANDKKCLQPIKKQLVRGGSGSVSFIIIRDFGAREYEVELGEKFHLTKDIAAGIKSLEGVIDARLN